MYTCGVCSVVVGPKVPMKKYVSYKDTKQTQGLLQIMSEMPVCGDCLMSLEQGNTMNETKMFRCSEPKKLYHSMPVGKATGVDKKTNAKPVRKTTVFRCDVCSDVIEDGEGQITAESVLCVKHITKVAKRGRRK